MFVCLIYVCLSASEHIISPELHVHFSANFYSAPKGKRSVVMTVSVCVFVCVFVRDPIFGTNKTSDLHEFFLRMLPMAVARFPYGGVVIRRVLQVLWMTSHLHISQSQAALGLAINGAYGIPVAGNGRTGLLLTVGIGGNTGGGVCGL